MFCTWNPGEEIWLAGDHKWREWRSISWKWTIFHAVHLCGCSVLQHWCTTIEFQSTPLVPGCCNTCSQRGVPRRKGQGSEKYGVGDFHQKVINTVDGRNPAPVEGKVVYPMKKQAFIHVGWLFGISSINSSKGILPSRWKSRLMKFYLSPLYIGSDMLPTKGWCDPVKEKHSSWKMERLKTYLHLENGECALTILVCQMCMR